MLKPEFNLGPIALSATSLWTRTTQNALKYINIARCIFMNAKKQDNLLEIRLFVSWSDKCVKFVWSDIQEGDLFFVTFNKETRALIKTK